MDEIINYVMNTPGNTNPNMLRGMLENNNTGGNNEPFGIEVYYDEDSDALKWRGTTFTEIGDAVDAGRIVYIKWYSLLCISDNRDAGNPNFVFSGIGQLDDQTGRMEIDTFRLFNDYTVEELAVSFDGRVIT